MHAGSVRSSYRQRRTDQPAGTDAAQSGEDLLVLLRARRQVLSVHDRAIAHRMQWARLIRARLEEEYRQANHGQGLSDEEADTLLIGIYKAVEKHTSGTSAAEEDALCAGLVSEACAMFWVLESHQNQEPPPPPLSPSSFASSSAATSWPRERANESLQQPNAFATSPPAVRSHKCNKWVFRSHV